MLSTLESIVRRYRESGGNVITLLQETQDALGYIPKEAVGLFSEQLGIAPSRFYGVATFYAQFRLKPTGKHKITACCGTACHVRGAERITGSLRRELRLTEENDTTSDGQITLEKVACLGFCSFAPVVLVDGAVHGKTTADTVIKEVRKLSREQKDESTKSAL
jgi:NADH:ubiquinone oxidoreductase subunit E